MLSPEERQRSALAYEGQILHAAGSCGAAHAADVARAAIDGTMNALIRLEGQEAAAKYAFALADRVAGAVLKPTEIAWSLPPPVPTPEEEAERPPAPSWRDRLIFWAVVGAAIVSLGLLRP